jgi:hypothetical protein
MTIRFGFLPAGLEEAQFKRVPEGWLFTTASPWVFARRRTYLASEEQKPALAARVRRGRYIRVLLTVAMLVLLVAAFVAAPSLLRLDSVGTWAWLGGFVLVFTVVVVESDYLNVRPLLRDLPRSTQRITFGDMARNQAAASSVKALAIFTGIFVFAATTNMLQSLVAGGSVLGAISAVMFVGLAILFAGMLAARLQTPEPAAAAAEPTIAGLSARLDRMERVNRGLGWSLAAVGIVAVLLVPFAVLTLLQSRLLSLNVQSLGAERVQVRNPSGERVATLFVAADGMPSLIMYDAKGKQRLNIALNSSGSPYVALTDADARLRATLGLNNDQDPNLLFVDAQAKVRTSVGVRGGVPSLWLADAQGKLRAELGLDNKQDAVLRLLGPDGRVQWNATAGAAVKVPNDATKDAPPPR